MAAELEEVVVDADVRPPRSRSSRQISASSCSVGVRGADETGRVPLPPGLRQGPAINFADGGDRQLVEHRPGRGHHVIGQALADEAAELGGRFLQRLAQYHVGGQAPGRAVGQVDDRGLPHHRMAAQRRLDLSQLDAETADLHLGVDTA